MSPRQSSQNDTDAYLDTLSDAEREEVRAASVALDIAGLVFRARTHRQMTQAEAAEETGLKQQSISRIEGGSINSTVRTLEKYLGELHFALTLSVIDEDTGKIVDQVTLNRPDDCADSHIFGNSLANSVPELSDIGA